MNPNSNNNPLSNMNYKCDICELHEVEYYGRWFGYCESCQQSGKGPELDRAKTQEMEIQPDIDSGNFDYTLRHNLTDYIDI